MRSAVVLLVVVLWLPALTLAQESENPFDVTALREMTGGAGVPDVARVAELESAALAAVDAGDCQVAVVRLDEYARAANALANFVAAGLEPFYNALPDDRRGFGGVATLLTFETLSNEYKSKRNRAMVMRAECFLRIGDRDQAVENFYQALRILDIDDGEWWTRARTGLYSILGVSAR